MLRILTLTIIFMSLFLTSSVVSATIYDINSPEVNEIASQFSMDGHSEHDLATCATKQRYYADIAALLNEGQTKEEIFDYYYSMYGEEGLRAPKKSGFSLVAWVTPFFVIIIAGVALFKGIQNMMSTRQDHQMETTEQQNIEEEIVKSMIHEERKKYY